MSEEEDKVANPHVGDVEIELNTGDSVKKFVMRPSFTSACEIEQQTGVGLIHLFEQANAGNLGVVAATHIIVSGMKAAGEPATFKKVGPWVFKTGILEVTTPIVHFLINALNGGEEPGEAKATKRN